MRSRVLPLMFFRSGTCRRLSLVREMCGCELGFSGVNPGDTKKRRGWLGSQMPNPRVIPHSDGAGTVDAVGPGVDPSRIGRRVWLYGAQSYRPFGTAAEFTVVPSDLAVDLPDEVSDEIGDLHAKGRGSR
jgi:NADPH:quinone reductase-like Zn-dependent oxidoreductase